MLWVLLLALDAGPPGDAAGRDGAVVRDAGYSEAADYGLQVAVEAEGAQPGDRVWLVLTLRYDKSLAIAVPEAMPEGRGLAPLGAPERTPEEVEGSLSETLRFPFVLLANANVETPSFELRVGEDVLNIPALPVVVNDAGPSAEPPDPDLPGMVVYRPGPAPWILPVVALGIGIILLVILLRAYTARTPAPADEPEVVVDAAKEFRAVLDGLRRRLHDDPDVLRACWFDLLAGLRVYLDRRFGLSAERSTTEELLAALAATRIVGIPRVGLSDLLRQADAVRYAAEDSSREAMADLLDQVEVWVGTAERAQAELDRS